MSRADGIKGVGYFDCPGGGQVVDVGDPAKPREITFWGCGGAGVVDARGLLYLIDRGRGLHILERV